MRKPMLIMFVTIFLVVLLVRWMRQDHLATQAARIEKVRQVFPDATDIRPLDIYHYSADLPGAPYAVYFGNTFKTVVCDAKGCADLEICR